MKAVATLLLFWPSSRLKPSMMVLASTAWLRRMMRSSWSAALMVRGMLEDSGSISAAKR